MIKPLICMPILSLPLHRALLVILLIFLQSCSDKKQVAQFSDGDIALNNKGVALMGRFEYRAGVDVFGELLERNPDWHEVRINYAIALKNRQQEQDGELALEQLRIVLAEDPKNLRANYVAGVLELYLGRVEPAQQYFQAALEQNSEDAYIHYYLGQCQLRLGEIESALSSYKKAIEYDPYLRSAYYSSAQVLRRLGRSELADEQLKLFQRFEKNPRARLAEFKYTRMGPLSVASVVGKQEDELKFIPVPEGELFLKRELVVDYSQDTQLNAKAKPYSSSHITTVDLNRDNIQDLFIVDPKGGTFLRSESNTTHSVESSPWEAVTDINAVAWGDIDNNGFVDVYLCRTGENQLWQQYSAGEWGLAGQTTNVGDGQNDCSDAVMFDADHDGDLDILVANRDAKNNLLNNNRDGSFRSLADKITASGSPTDTRQILISDIDADDDVDIVFINHTAPHRVLINDRLWNYIAAAELSDLEASEIVAIASADLGADGQNELFTMDPKGQVHLWRRTNHDSWASEVLYQSNLDEAVNTNLAALDMNGNGQSELALLSPGRIEVLELAPKSDAGELIAQTLFLDEYIGGIASPVILSNQGYSFVAMGEQAGRGGVVEWAPGPGRHDFLNLNFTGKHDAAETMRSNHSGIGTLASVRTGSNWSRADTHKNSSLLGYSLQPLAIGLRGMDKADFVEIDWSDGVYQSEIDVPGNSIQTIAEEQRQLGSCPVLFVWNGEKFDFVTDILGVAAQGFLVEPGTLLPPRPWERITFPPGSLKSKDGRIQFKVTEPMEENSYIDSVVLESYDVPENWQLVVDERMGTGAPEVTGQTMFYQNVLSPVAAKNSAGTDVHESILKHDQSAMPPGEIDRNYIGLLKRPESLTLEFDQAIDRLEGSSTAIPVLIAENWVELPYSQTHFAAWQAGRQYRSISLEARVADGEWQMVYPEFGIPGGMPRTMSLPMLNLPEGTDALRLSWNRELYWDRVRVAFSEQPAENISVSKSTPSTAKVVKSGFYERVNHAQRRPEYIYQKRKAFGDVRYPTGFYTSLGEMTELVTNSDDALAIIGPGEEIHVEFEEPSPPQPGFKRWYVLDVKGWAKDSDRFTYQGKTVGPLPRTYPNENSAAREALHQRYNTRFQSGQ